MKYTITKINGQHVCQVVLPECLEPEDYKWFPDGKAYHFVHPSPETLPDHSIVNGDDLSEVFWEYFSHDMWIKSTEEECKIMTEFTSVRQSISFKNPELMQIQHWVSFKSQWLSVTEGTYNEALTHKMKPDTKVTFIRTGSQMLEEQVEEQIELFKQIIQIYNSGDPFDTEQDLINKIIQSGYIISKYKVSSSWRR